MNAFQKTALATLAATILLITVGSLVRITGAGLGCPDWPRCWGSWLPPASVEALDMAYVREKGYDPADFNPVKMWTEYANRLVGVVIGILVFVTFLRSFRYRMTQPAVFYCAGLCFVLVGFQGWLGGQVVRSGLQPGIITLHMALAVILLCLLLFVTFQSMEQRLRVELTGRGRSVLLRLGFALLAVTAIQVLIGTQVREGIDPFIKDDGGLPRGEWLARVGLVDHVHRFSSWLVLIAGVLLYRAVRRHGMAGKLHAAARFILAAILLQIALGVVLAYGGLPPGAQVLHLTLATLLVCGECMFLLMVRASRR
ncbi:MAG: COX15/CtaA family protein [Gemmatimonadota bacterium]|nr:COX15/CtaA family protein [Gemmatimonadota bacterium]